MSLTAELLKEFEHKIESIEVIPSRRGVFEVTLDGELVFSKKGLGRHAEPGEVLDLFKERIK